ncbi:MAG: hypothetical protein J7621_02280 [Niastella sp.]|nr:hypothetical protein [Niastella sp.]
MQIIRRIVIIILSFVPLLLQAQPKAQRVALISDHIDPAEKDALLGVLQKVPGYIVQPVTLAQLQQGPLAGYACIWYHRTDTTAPDAAEKAIASRLSDYVEQGGNLFLGMEAMPLLNTWNWEPAPVTLQYDTVKDEGFGRPLGFHAFKTHPLFDGLQGGVYVSKQPADHVVRKHGFYGNSIPERARIAGIDWTYITFTENNKLLAELQKGKGKVIAAGAYLYYAASNYNKQHLGLFTGNVLRYLTGGKSAEKARYWTYAPVTVQPAAFNVAPLAPVKATNWQLPKPSLQVSVNQPGADFYDLSGRRMLWMGKLNGGMEELWLHPFMALRDLEAGVQLSGADSVHWLRNVQPSVTVTPEYLIRRYTIGNVILKEIYTVSYDQPYGVAHYEMEGAGNAILHVSFAANLRYMWPYSQQATRSIKYGFSNAVNGHLIAAQDGELNTAVLYSGRPLKEAAQVIADRQTVRITTQLSLLANAPVNVYITGSSTSMQEALQPLRKDPQQLNRLFLQSNKHYRDLLAGYLHFSTPDSLFDQGYAWALVRTDQFVQTTPGLGTALMAGFGTTARGWNGRHTISGRPGYAWYFGRDAQWSAMAIDAYGGYDRVKEQLATFIRFQDLNGKIYHELTSSAVAHYDASDATPLFIVLAAHYLKYSGDIAFIRSIWPQIELALQFCYSTDTDGDGLIENTNVGHGWIEGGPLFGTHTEFYLAGSWAAALESIDYMSKALGKDRKQYAQEAMQVKRILDNAFWNKDKQYFYNGKYKDGTYMDQSTGFATVPIYLKAIIDTAKAFTVVQRITGSKFTTDWGLRMLEEDNPKYKAGSYHAGMVWPLYGGWASLTSFSSGLYKAGYQYLMSNALVYRDWAPGSIEETLNGDIYKPNGVCANQCWSETMVVQPAIEGMLGLQTDAVQHKMQLAPYFPWHWPFAQVRNIRMGNTLLQMQLKRTAQQTIYELDINGRTALSFAPALPLLTNIQSVTLDGKQVAFNIRDEADGIRVALELDLQPGRHVVAINTSGGTGVLPVVTKAVPGQPSGGLKILSEKATDTGLEWLAEGRPGKTYQFKVVAHTPLAGVQAARIVAQDKEVVTLEVTMPASGEAYSQQTIRVSLK